MQRKVSGGICCFFRPSTETETETKTETETETPSGMRRTDPDPLAEDTDVNLDSELTRVQLTTTAEFVNLQSTRDRMRIAEITVYINHISSCSRRASIDY